MQSIENFAGVRIGGVNMSNLTIANDTATIADSE